MSNILQSPIEAYYAGETANFEALHNGKPVTISVTPHSPQIEQVQTAIESAQWQVFDAPNSTRQFEGLVFNPDAQGSTLLVPTTAGEYNAGHKWEGGVRAAQDPNQRIVLLPTFSLTRVESFYYARTGRLTSPDGKPLPSLQYLSQALQAQRIEVTHIYGRSAGTKGASVLPKIMPSVQGVVLDEPPQLTKRTTASFTRGALQENSKQRLIASDHDAEDIFQVDGGRKQYAEQTGQQRNRRANIAATAIGNTIVRVSHAFGLSKGSEAFLADLSHTNIDLIVYTGDALYSSDQLQAGLGHIATSLSESHSQMSVRIVQVPGNHRMPERYPCASNDLTNTLIQTQ